MTRWLDGRCAGQAWRATLLALALAGTAGRGQAAEAVPPTPAASAPQPAASAASAAEVPGTDPSTAEPAAAASPPTTATSSPGRAGEGSPAPLLDIEAPGPIKDLLAKYLDLARAIALPGDSGIGRYEWSRLIAGTPAQAANLIQPLGYFAPQISLSRETGSPQRVHLSVDPGPIATVAKLSFNVEGELNERAEQGDAQARRDRSAIEALWPLTPGNAFSNAAWAQAKTQILARLYTQGYAAATWAGTQAEVDAAHHAVRLFAVVDSGPLYRAGEIEVDGLQHQDADRVRALAGFVPGDALTESRLLDYQARLLKTGLFDQVNVSLDSDPAQAAHAQVLVHLREAPRKAATAALGFSANTGPRATLEYVDRRLFGRPLTARDKFLWGGTEQSWDGDVSTQPDSHFQRRLIGGTVDRLLTDTDVELSQRVRLGVGQDRPGIEQLRFVEIERSRECARLNGVAFDCADINARSVQLQQTRHHLDNDILPTVGSTLQWQVGIGEASGSASRSGGFLRLYGRATHYWPLGNEWYSQARLELGRVFTPSGVQVPDSQRFRAGGDDSVRGYAWRTLAPLKADGSVTGGTMLFTSSVEIAHPISARLPSVWWDAFVDAGRAADDLSALRPALGYGAGLRWRSPVGPLRMDLAWGREVHHLRLHLSVGIAF